MAVKTPYSLQILWIGLWICFGCLGCKQSHSLPTKITLWHQMVVAERVVLAEQIAEFERQNPDIRVTALYKETEELRSGFQAAVLAGTGPELVYGPSDALGAFASMGIVQDMSGWFTHEELTGFIDQSLTWLNLPSHSSSGALNTSGSRSEDSPLDAALCDKKSLVQVGDRVGNHLALVYNRRLVAEPPQTTDDLVRLAIEQTSSNSGAGQPASYGLVWNFVEPFFLVPFLSGFGGCLFEGQSAQPTLDTPQVVAALEFVSRLQRVHRVMPANCDYETADMLFKTGRAAMIINGDWSWSDYLRNPNIDAAIAPLPVVSETGLAMSPMVATKGYSLNANSIGAHAEAARRFTRFMLSEPVQIEYRARLKTLPSLKSLTLDDQTIQDPTLAVSAEQVARSRPMPVIPEMRAVWDAMRPAYQSLLAGELTAAIAARQMQSEAERRIRVMNQELEPGPGVIFLQTAAFFLLIAWVYWQRSYVRKLIDDWPKNRMAYTMIAPAAMVTILTIVYPFALNVVLSFSNMSLRNFRNWQVVGLQNYWQVLTESQFLWVLGKTIVWTAANLIFHLTIGLMLAVALNGPVRGKSIYRVLLILPWAIPAYITALSWRGMFDVEYGSVNAILGQVFGMGPVNWLGEEFNAFLACLITNIWLGFPFIMVIALGGMQGIPMELYEAAQIDRVSRWRQFWHITLPMLRPVLIPAATLGAIWTFNNLNVVWLVSNGGEPADKTHILVSYVYKSVFNMYQYGSGAALSMIIFMMLWLFSVTLLKRTRAAEAVV